jgi:hypothetical protein
MSKSAKQLDLLDVTTVYEHGGAPAPAPTVGFSERTSGKHSFLDALVGKVCGVTWALYRERPLVMHELTAGDGAARGGAWDRTCSPGIFTRHLEWCAEHGVTATAYLSEMAPETWERLRDNLKENLVNRGWEIQQGWLPDTRLVAYRTGASVCAIDAALRHTPARNWAVHAGEIGFVFHDPNHVAQSDFPAEFLPASRELLMCVLTMAFNAGGIKRLPLDTRRGWSKRIDAVRARVQRHQDLMLVRLVNDASQWAYLAVAPRQWRRDVMKIAHSSFKAAGFATEIIWLRDDPEAFQFACERLIHTRLEMAS